MSLMDWLKEGVEKFKQVIGVGADRSIIEGTALREARALLGYCESRPLRRGDRGDQVARLQFLLSLLGYRTYTTPIPDGVFGPMTEAAVIDFQRKHGLRPTGVVDKFTAYELFKEIQFRTKFASIIPRAVEKTLAERVRELERKYPEYFTTLKEEKEERVVAMPKRVEETDEELRKKILIALGIIAAAMLLKGD